MSVPSKPFKIRSNDRISAVGKTGSGKTHCLMKLVWDAFSDVAFYDMTGYEAPKLDAPTLRTIDEVRDALFPDNPEHEVTRFAYSPEIATYEDFGQFCHYLYQHGNIMGIADELMAVYRENNSVRPIQDDHQLILTNGRKRNVGFASATQRPVNVPLETLSEAEHVFTYKLKLKRDRDRMVQIQGEPAEQARSLTDYRYVYDHDDLDEAQVCEALPER